MRYLAGERGAAVNAANANGCTALMVASIRGHLDVVRYLAGERRAVIAAAQPDGTTALMFAADSDQHRVYGARSLLGNTLSR